MRQWNHETKKEEKKERKDTGKKNAVSYLIWPFDEEEISDVTSSSLSEIDIDEETLPQNGLRGKQISESRGVRIECCFKCHQSVPNLRVIFLVTGGDSVTVIGFLCCRFVRGVSRTGSSSA